MSSKQSRCESLIFSTTFHKYTQSQVLLTMPEIPLAKKKKNKTENSRIRWEYFSI